MVNNEIRANAIRISVTRRPTRFLPPRHQYIYGQRTNPAITPKITAISKTAGKNSVATLTFPLTEIANAKTVTRLATKLHPKMITNFANISAHP
jgi:hypothetical protein